MPDEPQVQIGDTVHSISPPLSLDEFIERVGGWAVVYSMYMALGGKLSGLPTAAQLFLARELEKAKAKGPSPKAEA
jgi:hypothetical protein